MIISVCMYGARLFGPRCVCLRFVCVFVFVFVCVCVYENCE